MNKNSILKCLRFSLVIAACTCSDLLAAIDLYDQPSKDSKVVKQAQGNESFIQEAILISAENNHYWYKIVPEAYPNQSIKGYIPISGLNEDGTITLETPIYEKDEEQAAIIGYISLGDSYKIEAISNWLQANVEKANLPLYFLQKEGDDTSDAKESSLPVEQHIGFSVVPKETMNLEEVIEDDASILAETVKGEIDTSLIGGPVSDNSDLNSSIPENDGLLEGDFHDKRSKIDWIEDDIKDQNVIILQDKYGHFKFAKPSNPGLSKPKAKSAIALCYLEGTLKANSGGPFKPFKKSSAPYFLSASNGTVIAYVKPKGEGVKAALNRACSQVVTLEGTCKLVDPKKPVLIEVEKVHFKTKL